MSDPKPTPLPLPVADKPAATTPVGPAPRFTEIEAAPRTVAQQEQFARKKTLYGLIEKNREQLATVVPKHVTPERLMKVAMIAISKSPKLLDCDPYSVMRAIMEAAQLGLDCGGSLGSAYLVPYGKECQMIIGYRGMIDLARRSGQIDSIEARPVYSNERFEIVYGTNPSLVHVPAFRPGETAGDLIAVYMLARLKGTSIPQVELMSKAQVDKIRAKSKAGGSGPWVDHYDEMARKTVVRRGMKYLPLSPELAEALEREDRGPLGFIDDLSGEEPEPPQTLGALTDQLKLQSGESK